MRRGLRTRPTSKNSMCDEFVDNPDYDDSHYNEHPIGNLHARYRCFSAKPFHGFPPDRPYQLAVSGRFTMATNDPNSAGCNVTTAEPAIAVARDQFIDGVADYPWDEVKEPCPLPVRKLARNVQHSLGFYIGLAVRYERKGIAQRADVLRPTASERSENSRGDPVCSRSCSRASIGRIRRRAGSGRAAS